jgi:hypothetical protein
VTSNCREEIKEVSEHMIRAKDMECFEPSKEVVYFYAHRVQEAFEGESERTIH